MFISFSLLGPFEIGKEISYLAKYVFRIWTPIFRFYPASQDIFSKALIIAVLMQRNYFISQDLSLYLNTCSEFFELLSKEQALDITLANSYGDIPNWRE